MSTCCYVKIFSDYNKRRISQCFDIDKESASMKYSTRLSDAAHIMAFIALHSSENLSSAAIARSIKTNPAYVRQLMSALRQDGLITTVKGHPNAALAKAPGQINLLEIYRAVWGDEPLIHEDTHTNPECGIGMNIQFVLRDCYDVVQKEAEDAMRAISLQEILNRYREKARSWNLADKAQT